MLMSPHRQMRLSNSALCSDWELWVNRHRFSGMRLALVLCENFFGSG